MKRISMLMLLAAVMYALTGCMITDYPCIYDTENPNYAECYDDPAPPIGTPPAGPLHDTRGWAHIIETSQSATDQDGDCLYAQFIPFVSQDSTGNQMIASLARRFEVPGCPAPPTGAGGLHVFHDDRYAQGHDPKGFEPYAYAIYLNSTYQGDPWDPNETAGQQAHGTYPIYGREYEITGDITGNCEPDPAYDPFLFDYQFTTNCMDADPDLSVLVAYLYRGTYPPADPDNPVLRDWPVFEAGRSLLGPVGRHGISWQDKFELLQEATLTDEGLSFTFWSSNTSVTLEQGPLRKTLDLSIFNGRKFTIHPGRHAVLGNQLLYDWGITPEEFLYVAQQFEDFVRLDTIDMTIIHNDISFNFPFALSAGFSPEMIAETMTKTVGSSETGGRRER
jgi:hypothetical protein